MSYPAEGVNGVNPGLYEDGLLHRFMQAVGQSFACPTLKICAIQVFQRLSSRQIKRTWVSIVCRTTSNELP